MKKRTFWLLLSCALLIFSIPFFSWQKEQNAAPTPEPSAWGGYYADPFTLELTAPKRGQIYYTTDGSTPTTDSQLYQDGIEIRDRSEEANVYRAVPNVVRFWRYYTPDPTPVPKGTVVRAMFVNESGIQSEVLTQTYFVGIQPPEQGYTLSLIFEPEDLFGEDGLYVTGREYDDWHATQEDPETEPEANFLKRIETTVTAEFMDGTQEWVQQKAGLRIQGASSRENALKRFILTARPEIGGSRFFDAAFFGDTQTHSVMLKDPLPDAVAADLLADRAVSVQRSIPVRVYLNGEFWYDSFLLERYDEDYFAQHYDVSKHILVKNGLVDDEVLAQRYQSAYDEYLYGIEKADFSDAEQWRQFQQQTDVQSYIDYIVTNYYFFNYDFSTYFNHVLWRSASKENDFGGDTRWRWCIYDMDAIEDIQTVETYDPSHKPVELNTFGCDYTSIPNDNVIFRALRSNEEFNRQFVLSFMDMVNNNFAPANVEKVLIKYGESLDWMDGFFRQRPQYAPQHLKEEFGLTGTLETVTVTTADPEMGSVKVNTSVIDLSAGSWSGQYFTDYPITLTAEPAQGYRFVGWKGGTEETASSVTVAVDGGVTLEAVFAET